MPESRSLSYSQALIETVQQDQAALFSVLRSAATLSAYLSSGCILAPEERLAIERGAALIIEATKAAAKDAGVQFRIDVWEKQ